MIHLIDHQDSFTYNIVDLLDGYDFVTVVDHRAIADTNFSRSSLVVLSPGPGKPEDYPETLNFIERTRGQTPVLGICLGFQMLMYADGASIIRQSQPTHGVATEVVFDIKSPLYESFVAPANVARYHSLQVDPATVPAAYEVDGWDTDKRVPLSARHRTEKRYGFQFHPESFLTDNGARYIGNIYDYCLN